jgi:eukaryotic-like serine/threonine-protein kinase
MTDERWRLAYSIYESAAPLAEPERRAFISAAAPDQEIADRVLAMLDEIRVASDSGGFPEPASTGYPVPESPASILPNGASLGRFVITGFVGQGGMGRVYSAHDPDLNREVALKVITPKAHAYSSETFIREAQAASVLNHPNIVTVYEVVQSGPTMAIVMELVTGTSLRQPCATVQPVELVAIWGRQIANALAEAHSRGIVHRDIKPENVMLRPDGLIKVLDFGLARRSGVDRADDEAALGTLGYLSPEEIEQRPITSASDIFSLGIVLYELASGSNPFRGASADATTRMILGLAPPPLPERSGAIPKELDRLVRSMLDKSAALRPTAREVALQLEALAKPGVLRRGAAWAAAVLAVCVIGAAVTSVWRVRPTELQISPLASMSGAERQPSFSPDGSQVAFAFTPAGGQDSSTHIYVKSVSSAGSMPLTAGALSDFRPAFSPDGTRVAFLRRAEGRLKVMVMPSSGGTARQCGEIVDLLREYAVMTWDATGQNLFVADRVSESRSEVALFQLSVETGARRQVTFPAAGESDWMPAVSPDGQTLGYSRLAENGRGDVWAVPIAGGRWRRLTDTNEVIFCWTWSAEGKDLLISYRRSARAYLWRQPLSGGRAMRVAGLDDQVKEISVARKGNLLVYGSWTEGDYNVWRYPLPPSTDLPKPLIASAAFDGDARYSPDGTRIAFASDRSGQSNIWICASDGSDVRQLTTLDTGGFTAGSPSWSPDGKWIAFDSRSPQSASSIFLLEASGGKPKRLTGPGPSDIVPNWSRDSWWVYFSSDRGGGPLQIWKVPASGGNPALVTRNGGLESFESPDGRFLYYTKRGRTSGFWRMPLNGGEETFVPELAAIANRYWESSPQGIYFVAPSQPPVLALFPFAGGGVTRVVSLPVQPTAVHRGISVSPDGRSLLYMQADVATSNLMVASNFR